jgi:hypothetical protein
MLKDIMVDLLPNLWPDLFAQPEILLLRFQRWID